MHQNKWPTSNNKEKEYVNYIFTSMNNYFNYLKKITDEDEYNGIIKRLKINTTPINNDLKQKILNSVLLKKYDINKFPDNEYNDKFIKTIEEKNNEIIEILFFKKKTDDIETLKKINLMNFFFSNENLNDIKDKKKENFIEEINNIIGNLKENLVNTPCNSIYHNLLTNYYYLVDEIKYIFEEKINDDQWNDYKLKFKKYIIIPLEQEAKAQAMAAEDARKAKEEGQGQGQGQGQEEAQKQAQDQAEDARKAQEGGSTKTRTRSSRSY